MLNCKKDFCDNSFMLQFGISWQTKLKLRIAFRCTQNAQQKEKILCKANSVAVFSSQLHCGQWKANCEFDRALTCNPHSCCIGNCTKRLSELTPIPNMSKGMMGIPDIVSEIRILEDSMGWSQSLPGENLLLEREIWHN